MTCSFHKYGDYFPGTGSVDDIGLGEGKNYAINFPLNDWIDDSTYEHVFKTVVGAIMEHYRPGAIVLQCGADSLAGDRLGIFNLTMKGNDEDTYWFAQTVMQTQTIDWKFGRSLLDGTKVFTSNTNGGPIQVYVKNDKIIFSGIFN